MVRTCSVPGCRSESYSGCNISFYSFPKNENIKIKWQKNLNITRPITKFSKVCSLHYNPTSFYTLNSLRLLKKDAIPIPAVAHVIANHSYGGVKRKADIPPIDENGTERDTTCHKCQESFQTATDLMVHASSHSEHACYVCGATFRSFLQLSRHGPGCANKRKATGRTRSPPRPQKQPQPMYKDDTTVRTTIIIPNQDQKILPERSRAETKTETSTNESMIIETDQHMDIELENCDDRLVNDDSNQETSQGILKLQFINESANKEEEKLDKIKIGSKKYEKTKKESKSSMKDEMKIDSSQEKSVHSNEVREKLDPKSTDCEQFDDNIPIKHIRLENEPEIEGSVVEQGKSLGERILTESLEMQTEPILDPELKSLTDMLEESNSTFNETNDSISGTEEGLLTSKNDLNSDKLPELKELTIGTMDSNVNSDSVDVQSQHQVDNTISMNAENHNETKDSIEKEMDKIFEEQMLEQDNSDNQNTIQVIPEIAENVKDLNEMKVHLAINPLNKEELFDTDVKITDLECENTQNSEVKLESEVSELSDSEHS